MGVGVGGGHSARSSALCHRKEVTPTLPLELSCHLYNNDYSTWAPTWDRFSDISRPHMHALHRGMRENLNTTLHFRSRPDTADHDVCSESTLFATRPSVLDKSTGSKMDLTKMSPSRGPVKIAYQVIILG